MSNFDDLIGIVLFVKIRTKEIYLSSYTELQQRLYGRVVALRDVEKLTFDAVAKLLTKSGARSPRGCLLGAEHVFSIYKKGKIREQRMVSEVNVSLENVEFVKKLERIGLELNRISKRQ